MNHYPRNERTSAHDQRAHRTDRSIREIMAGWPMQGFAFDFSSELFRRLILVLGILLLSLTFGVILSICGRKTYFDFASRPSHGESGGGVAAEKGDFPYADGASGSARLPLADKVEIIPANSINASNAAFLPRALKRLIKCPSSSI